MSYEGYEQIICENGHYHEESCWLFNDPADWLCDCGGHCIWWNSVDTTNGLYDIDKNGQEVGERIDGYIEVEVDVSGKRCEHCGHQIGGGTYKVPEKGGNHYPHPLDVDLGECEECGSPDNGKCVCDDEECPEEEFEQEQDAFYDEQVRLTKQKEEEEFGIGLTDEELQSARRATPEETEKYRKAIEEKTGQPRPPRKSNRDEEEFGAGLK